MMATVFVIAEYSALALPCDPRCVMAHVSSVYSSLFLATEHRELRAQRGEAFPRIDFLCNKAVLRKGGINTRYRESDRRAFLTVRNLDNMILGNKHYTTRIHRNTRHRRRHFTFRRTTGYSAKQQRQSAPDRCS